MSTSTPINNPKHFTNDSPMVFIVLKYIHKTLPCLELLNILLMVPVVEYNKSGYVCFGSIELMLILAVNLCW